MLQTPDRIYSKFIVRMCRMIWSLIVYVLQILLKDMISEYFITTPHSRNGTCNVNRNEIVILGITTLEILLQ